MTLTVVRQQHELASGVKPQIKPGSVAAAVGRDMMPPECADLIPKGDRGVCSCGKGGLLNGWGDGAHECTNTGARTSVWVDGYTWLRTGTRKG